MKTVRIMSFTAAGMRLSERMEEVLKTEYKVSRYTTCKGIRLADWCAQVFGQSDALIFIGACGIAVRTIAPYLRDKTQDPAVLVADEKGNYVISLLSGHLGGGNALAGKLAKRIGAKPVITTASDVNGKIAIDVWAAENGLAIADMTLAKRVAADIVAGKRVRFFCDGEVSGNPPWELFCGDGDMDAPPEKVSALQVAVTVCAKAGPDVLRLIPRAVTLGIGCRRGKPFAEIKSRVLEVLRRYRIAPESIGRIASIAIKCEEPGLTALAKEFSVPFVTFDAEELRRVPGSYTASGFVADTTGVDNVCERAAMAALPEEEQKTAKFICRKTASDGVTVALLAQKWGVHFE